MMYIHHEAKLSFVTHHNLSFSKAEEPAAEKPAEEENKESSEDLGLSPEEIVKMDWEESFRWVVTMETLL